MNDQKNFRICKVIGEHLVSFKGLNGLSNNRNGLFGMVDT